MKHGIKLGAAEYDVGLSRTGDGYRLHVDGQTLAFRLLPSEHGGWLLHSAEAGVASIEHLAIAVDGDDVHIHLAGETYQLRFEHALERLAQLNEGAIADVIRSTMPGSLISLDVNVGEHVKKGQTLMIMESMKMETTIIAPRDGVVAELHVSSGEAFNKDALLVTLEPEAPAETEA